MILKNGDSVALIAPSGWFLKEYLNNGVKWLKKQGLNPVLSKHIYEKDFYEAGTAKHRADDINDAFSNKDIKALFCIRGGAGALKVLDFIDYNLVKKNPKPVFGLSDSTALQNALFTKTKNVSYTGFLPIYDFKTGNLSPLIEESFLKILKGQNLKVKQFDILNNGNGEGVLVGGCLSVFLSLCGTPYFPNLENKIILIEDVGEKTYHIDLMLQQLKMQKGFDKIHGIIFGQFENCLASDPDDGSVEDIIKRFSKELKVPVVFHFPYGHIKDRVILPIGKKIKMDLLSSCIQEMSEDFENSND